MRLTIVPIASHGVWEGSGKRLESPSRFGLGLERTIRMNYAQRRCFMNALELENLLKLVERIELLLAALKDSLQMLKKHVQRTRLVIAE
jgi:hypothetical protein